MLGRDGIRVFLAGGAVNVDYRATFDAEAIRYSRGFSPDATILSMGAIEAKRGLMDFEPDEAAYKRALLDGARRAIVVADAEKFDRPGTVHVADFTQIHDLVTDLPAPPVIAEAATRAGVQLHLA